MDGHEPPWAPSGDDYVMSPATPAWAEVQAPLFEGRRVRVNDLRLPEEPHRPWYRRALYWLARVALRRRQVPPRATFEWPFR